MDPGARSWVRRSCSADSKSRCITQRWIKIAALNKLVKIAVGIVTVAIEEFFINLLDHDADSIEGSIDR